MYRTSTWLFATAYSSYGSRVTSSIYRLLRVFQSCICLYSYLQESVGKATTANFKQHITTPPSLHVRSVLLFFLLGSFHMALVDEVATKAATLRRSSKHWETFCLLETSGATDHPNLHILRGRTCVDCVRRIHAKMLHKLMSTTFTFLQASNVHSNTSAPWPSKVDASCESLYESK